MALARVTILLTMLFMTFTVLIFAASCTPFFNKERIAKIFKWTAISTGALTLTALAFILIFAFDHSN